MSQTTLNVRIDSSLKQQFDEICADMGMTASTAVTVFVRTLVRERRIPFAVTASQDPFYSESNRRHLQESLEQYRQGKVLEHELVEEADA